MKLWLMWVLLSAVAFWAGGLLGRSLSPSEDLIVIGYVALSASLVLAGVLQSLMLRRLIDSAGWWVLASMGAVTVLGVLVFGLGLINRDVGWVMGVVGGWILLGAFQALLLRDRFAGGGWWVLANAVALIVAIPVVGLVTWLIGVPADSPMGGSLRWLAFGAAYGVVTGTGLWWLVRARLAFSMP